MPMRIGSSPQAAPSLTRQRTAFVTLDRLRTSLAAAALAASVSIAGVASAHEGKDSGKSGGSAKACKGKAKGKGYEVQGLFSSADLEQVAGAGTARTNDDRFSGTVVVEVQKGNRRGRRDVGLSLYAVTGVRVLGTAADGTLPAEGARVQLVGKQLVGKPARSCEPAPTTPTPTTPEPTTPTDEDPTATALANRPGDRGPKTDDPEPEELDEDEATEDVSSDDDSASEDRASATDDDKASDDGRGKDDDRRKTSSDDAPSGDDDSSTAADDEEVAEPTAVTDVAIRVVHFKVRPAGRR